MSKVMIKNQNILKLLLCVAGGYVFLVIAFYYLTGEQLHYRSSRDNFDIPPAEAVTVDLYQGNSVEQEFRVDIQRLFSVSVLWGTYYRANSGTVTMELYNKDSGALIISEAFDASAITEGALTTLTFDVPNEEICGVPLLLRLYADSQEGCAVTPLMSASVHKDGFFLSLNGENVDGVLCMQVQGEDYIWTGLHYWQFAFGFGIILLLSGTGVYYRYKKGKRSYVIGALLAVKKYKFLIRQLVSRDFKTKYKRSVLGVFWSFLNPLLTMIVQYVVFSTLFKSNIDNYAAYLIIGVVCFNFFSEATGMALVSIVGNAGLITKVYVPKYIYPLTRVMSSLVNLVISLIPLLLVTLASGLMPTKAYLLVPFALFCLMIFCLGVGFILSSAMVFFRDTQFLWGVLSMIWMYMTPIFYPIEILPDNLLWILKVNPLYHFITFIRTCMIAGVSPEPIVYVQCMMIASGTLLVGAVAFRKTQDKFLLYL